MSSPRKTIKEVESKREAKRYLYFVALNINLYCWEGGRKDRKVVKLNVIHRVVQSISVQRLNEATQKQQQQIYVGCQ